MSPRMGQKLTDNPKDTTVKARMDKETLAKLDCLVSKQNSDRSKVIRQGIYEIYDDLEKSRERKEKMIVGDRTESVVEKRARHIMESENEIASWNNELQYAIEHNNIQHEEYCRFMIKIWENTLEKLKNYEIS